VRKLVLATCVLASCAMTEAAAHAAPGQTRAERSCTVQTTELRSERDYNKANVTVCLISNGTLVRGETLVDCWFYKGLGWWADQPCNLKAQFLIEFYKNDVPIAANKSAILTVNKADGLGLRATMAGDFACPLGTTSIVVTAGLLAQQYWTDYGEAEKPYGLVKHTVTRTC
jgi:hypothetical protein